MTVSVLEQAAYARESVADVRAAGIERLLELHYHEITHYPDIALDIDWEMYAAAEEAGRLHVYTARIDGELVGYSVHFVNRNPKYRSSIQAVEDVLFVDPEHRKGSVGFRLIRFADRCLKEAGCQLGYRHMKAKHAFPRLLERQGYELVDFVHAKRFDRN